MRVLVGMEESGTIRDAFAKRGHDAWSCDLKPTRSPGNHIQGDIYIALQEHFDLIIMHPDCTALTVAGNGTYGRGKSKHQMRLDAIDFTDDLWLACLSIANKVCFENPVSVLATQSILPKPQYIHPWQFGHMEQKKTALFKTGLPDLVPTNDVYEQMIKLPKKERQRIHYMSPGKNRARDRSVTFQGVGEAMADQWGIL